MFMNVLPAYACVSGVHRRQKRTSGPLKRVRDTFEWVLKSLLFSARADSVLNCGTNSPAPGMNVGSGGMLQYIK